MGRPVILGNGSLTVGIDEVGFVHDFYYPYVGLDNLTTARSLPHKIGVWVDEKFSWLDNGKWTVTVGSDDNALISLVSYINEELGLEIRSEDFIDPFVNAFFRKVSITNKEHRSRNVRLFFHQVFEISRAGRADTVFYEPNLNYLLDYKGRCSLLIYSQAADGLPFYQYSVGNYGIEGKEGTWRDAEDGNLSNNPVEHGCVDSVIANNFDIQANSTAEAHYWIVAADSQYSAEKIHKDILSEGLVSRLSKAKDYWQDWLSTADDYLTKMKPIEVTAIKKSLMIIKAHTDKRGGIIASCDSNIYNYGRDYYSYVWPRDGAYAMWPLIRLGYRDEPKRFFEFCRDTMNPAGYMMHKYQPDKSIGSTWHPLVHGQSSELAIQEDETAIIITLLNEYLDETEDIEFVSSLYTTMIRPMADFMTVFRDNQTKLPHASYDLWEEKFLTNTYTTAMVYNALVGASRIADMLEYPDDAVKWKDAADEISLGCEVFFDQERHMLRKGFLLQEDGSLYFDNTLDVSSAYGSMMFAAKTMGVANVRSTYEAIERILLNACPAGGVPRYEYDGYFMSDPPYMGNPWHVTTLWLSQYYLQTKREDEAEKLINWTLRLFSDYGALSEQINPSNGKPLSVMPLVWSHSELINTLLDLRG